MSNVVIYADILVPFALAFMGVGISVLLNHEAAMTRLAIMFAAVVASLLVGGGLANYFFRSRGLLTGKVGQLLGPVILSTHTYNSEYGLATVWSVRFGSHDVRLPNREHFAAFEDGAAYRFYYVRNYPIDQNLSVEAL